MESFRTGYFESCANVMTELEKLQSTADAFSVLPVDADPAIGWPTLQAMVGNVGKATILKWIQAGQFPPGFFLSNAGNSPRVWRLSVINEWLSEREQCRNDPLDDAKLRQTLRNVSAAGREKRAKALRRKRKGA